MEVVPRERAEAGQASGLCSRGRLAVAPATGSPPDQQAELSPDIARWACRAEQLHEAAEDEHDGDEPEEPPETGDRRVELPARDLPANLPAGPRQRGSRASSERSEARQLRVGVRERDSPGRTRLRYRFPCKAILSAGPRRNFCFSSNSIAGSVGPPLSLLPQRDTQRAKWRTWVGGGQPVLPGLEGCLNRAQQPRRIRAGPGT